MLYKTGVVARHRCQIVTHNSSISRILRVPSTEGKVCASSKLCNSHITRSCLRTLPFVRKDHPILAETSVAKQTFTRFDFVVPSSSEPYTPIIRKMYEQDGQRPEYRVHMTDYFPLVRRIVASTDAVGLVAKAFTLTGWFREAFVALPDAGLLEPLVLAYAVRARWPIKPAAKDLIARVRQGWSSARHS